jgi:hypothetical protein
MNFMVVLIVVCLPGKGRTRDSRVAEADKTRLFMTLPRGYSRSL